MKPFFQLRPQATQPTRNVEGCATAVDCCSRGRDTTAVNRLQRRDRGRPIREGGAPEGTAASGM